jgi:predicted glycosyltransferase involved in capsule biosynthesis
MRALGLLVLLMVPTAVRGQEFPFELWHEGRIVLLEGDTLHGNVKYDMQSDIVMFSVSEKIQTFSARKIAFFEIFDGTIKQYRQFYALPFSSVGSYRTAVFFELLAEGKLTLLCRESIEYRTNNSYFYYYSTYTRRVLVNRFYFLRENGEIEEWKGSKADLLQLMGRAADEVETYMKQNKLKADDKLDLAKTVKYYNSFFLPK